MKIEVMVGYEPTIDYKGEKLAFKAFRLNALRRRKTADHKVEVYRDGTMVASITIPWNKFSGSPKSYPDYALEAISAKGV